MRIKLEINESLMSKTKGCIKRQKIVLQSDEMDKELLNSDNIARLLFACEFAINKSASEIIGSSVRADISVEE